MIILITAFTASSVLPCFFLQRVSLTRLSARLLNPPQSLRSRLRPRPPAQTAAPKAESEDKTAELRSGGFKYIPFEKDQQGSYTMDPSKANAPRSPEIEQEMANDRKYLLIYSLIGAVIFAIIVAAVILSGILSA